MRSGDGPYGQGDRSFVESARREQFVRCTVEALCDVGYSATTVLEVARRAGVSKSLVLYHVGSRAQLIDAVVSEIYERTAVDFLRDRVDEDLPADDWLAAYLRACVAFVGAHHRELVALGEIFVHRRSGPAQDGDDRARAEPYHHVARQLERGQRDGVFRPFSVPVMARTIRVTLDDLAAAHGADPSLDLGLHADELVTLFDRATTGRPRHEGAPP